MTPRWWVDSGACGGGSVRAAHFRIVSGSQFLTSSNPEPEGRDHLDLFAAGDKIAVVREEVWAARQSLGCLRFRLVLWRFIVRTRFVYLVKIIS